MPKILILLKNWSPQYAHFIPESGSIFVLYALVLNQSTWNKTKDQLCSQDKDRAVIQGNITILHRINVSVTNMENINIHPSFLYRPFTSTKKLLSFKICMPMPGKERDSK